MASVELSLIDTLTFLTNQDIIFQVEQGPFHTQVLELWNPLNGITVNRFIWLMGSFFRDLHVLLELIPKCVLVNRIIALWDQFV
jgi:hypothetical protein